MSMASSRWPAGGRRANASRRAASRSAARSSCSRVAIWSSGMFRSRLPQNPALTRPTSFGATSPPGGLPRPRLWRRRR